MQRNFNGRRLQKTPQTSMKNVYILTRELYVNDGRLIPEALSDMSEFQDFLLLLSRLQNGKNHKQEDTAVLKGHLTSLTLVFVRHFTHQNRGNFGGIFSIWACTKEISPKIPCSVVILITNAL